VEWFVCVKAQRRVDGVIRRMKMHLEPLGSTKACLWSVSILHLHSSCNLFYKAWLIT
jgi:hypothetical protein